MRFISIDFSTLTLVNNELLPRILKKLQCDVIYGCKINQGKDYLYLILEHQSSSPKKMMALRVRDYVIALEKHHLKQGHKSLPLIWPLVVYHGRESPCPFLIDHWELFSNPQLAREWADKPRQLIDFSVMTDQLIVTHGPIAIMEWIMRDAFISGDSLLEQAKKHLSHPLFREWMENSEECKIACFEYIMQCYRGKKSPEEVVDELAQAIPEEEDVMLSTAQKLEQRGLQQGMQQGRQEERFEIARNMLADGINLELVKKYTGLPEEVIAKLH